MHTIRSKDGTYIVWHRSGTGTPLLLVHGSAADHTRWAPILPALEEHFTVFAIDRRGRGGSIDTEPYAIQREFEDIAALIDSVSDGSKVNVLAHSYGALCAFEAAMFTTNLRKLILYEPSPPGLRESPDTIAKMRQHLEADDREGVLNTFLLEVAGLTPTELELMRSVPAWQGRVIAAHTILRELESISTLPSFDAEYFGQLETPTLLLLGGDSHAAYRETIEQINSILPNS